MSKSKRNNRRVLFAAALCVELRTRRRTREWERKQSRKAKLKGK